MWDAIWTPRKRARDAGTRRRDPFSIGLSILINFGPVAPWLATLVGSAVIGGVLLGASLLVDALTPKAQAPQAKDRQATVRQSVGARWRFYGRVKVGGTLWFFESKNGILYSGITLNEGEISAIQEIWLNDQQVELSANDIVQDEPYGTGDLVRLYFKLGTADQTAHASLLSAFPTEFTANHRLIGVANVLGLYREVAADRISEVYPQGNPAVRIVIDASIVKSVRTGERIWSDNPADVIYDYLTGIDAAGFPYGGGFTESQVDLESFQAFADLCDEPVALKAGGTTKRYTINGGYALNEEMRSVLARMCAACDGDLYVNSHGKMAIRGGRWIEPSLTLDSSLGHIISGEFRQGRSALAAFNELNITYVDRNQDYLDTEGERWLDGDNIALRGKVLSEQLDLPMVYSHAQARRLAKIYTTKNNPLWSGTIVTNFYGLNALGEDTVTIKFGPLGIDTTFLIQSVKILDDLTGVQLEVSSLAATAYEWDAETEEGTGPSDPPDTSTPIDIPVPADFHVSAAELVVDGLPIGTYVAATWTEPARTSLSQEVEYQLSGDPAWTAMSVVDGQGFAQSGVVSDGGTYGVRARTRSPGGVYSDYTATEVVVATPDTGAPAAPTGVAALGGEGLVLISAVHSAGDNSVGARIYINTINDFVTSTIVATEYGSPSTAFSYEDAVVAGTYYYWVVAINGSYVESTEAPTGSVTAT